MRSYKEIRLINYKHRRDEEDEFYVNIGKHKFGVKVSSLKITDKEQTYIIRNQGILKINENHMYATNKRSDIILKIKLIV